MAIENPYSPPTSDVANAEKKRSIGVVILIIITISVVTEVVVWFLVPLISKGAASALFFHESPRYLNALYAIDVILSFLTFFLACSASIKLSKINPFVATLPIASIGFFLFYLEIGSFSCLGRCGAPLWYDLVSMLKYFTAAIVASILFREYSSDKGKSGVVHQKN